MGSLAEISLSLQIKKPIGRHRSVRTVRSIQIFPVCSIQIFPDRSNRKGRCRKRDHKRAVHKFKNRICRGSAAVETLRNGSPENVWKRNIAMVLGPRPPRKSAVENFCGDSPDRPYYGRSPKPTRGGVMRGARNNHNNMHPFRLEYSVPLFLWEHPVHTSRVCSKKQKKSF